MFKNYLKIAFRHLWRQKWFSLINISGLAIAFTVSFLILLYVNFELSYNSFHSKSDRIYKVVTKIKTPSDDIEAGITAWGVPPKLVEQFEEIESAIRFYGFNPLLDLGDRKVTQENMIVADSDFFTMFDFKLKQGNPETVLKKPFSIVVTEERAKALFGNENPIGKTFKILDGNTATITGVMEEIPKNSDIEAEMILSYTTYSEVLLKQRENNWHNYGAITFILLTPNTDAKLLESKFPDFFDRNIKKTMDQLKMYPTLFLQPLKKIHLYSPWGKAPQPITYIYVLTIIAFVILVIGIINFINLTTARSVERAKEVGLRKVLGVKKHQLIFQFLSEAFIISFIAFLLSVLLSELLLANLNSLVSNIVTTSIFNNVTYIFYLLLVALITGFLSGIYPAFVLSNFKPISVLKGSFATDKKSVFLRKTLVIIQFSVSIILIIGTAITYNQTNFMLNQNLGFDKDQQVIIDLSNVPPKNQLTLKQEIVKLPHIKSASLSRYAPGYGEGGAYSKVQNSEGEMQITNLNFYFIDYDFIPQYQFELIAGRPFSKDFTTDQKNAMIINEKASKLFGYATPKDAIGAKYSQWGSEGKIIGVVKDFHSNSLEEEIRAFSMRINNGNNSYLSIKLEANQITQGLNNIQQKWGELYPDLEIDYDFLDTTISEQYEDNQRFKNILLIFSILAILISCLGLLGLSAYSTYQKRREIGIRKVNGASIKSIVILLSKDFIKLVLIALFIACPISWHIINGWLQDFPYHINLQWWVFIVAGITAIGIALFTVSFHAIKASLANPVKSLKTE